VPDLSVTTDVIVGFPGETDAEFEDSIAFIEEMDFARLHVFRYSPRELTAAMSMPGQVGPAVAQERSNRMHELAQELTSRFQRRFIGRTLPVLWEAAEPRAEGLRWSGLSDNYIRVVTDAPVGLDLHNRVTDTQIMESNPGSMTGLAQIRPGRERRAG